MDVKLQASHPAANSSVSDSPSWPDKNKKPEKNNEPLQKTGGRNNQGFITARHRGGGHKRKYRIIDLPATTVTDAGPVTHIEYDPNRSARIAHDPTTPTARSGTSWPRTA